jgi:hypothetical protein
MRQSESSNVEPEAEILVSGDTDLDRNEYSLSATVVCSVKLVLRS